MSRNIKTARPTINMDETHKESIEVQICHRQDCIKAKLPATQQRIFWTGVGYGAIGTLALVLIIQRIARVSNNSQ